MNIPSQLQNPEFRFVKIRKKEKGPFEKGWQETSNYEYNDEELSKWILSGGNYGVACGYGNLVVIDCDKEKVWKAVEDKLPETFTVRTGSGKKHFYYIVKDFDKPIRLKEETMGDLGDIQSKGKQVVGPGSIHPSGGIYEVEKDIPLTEITQTDVHVAIAEFLHEDYFSKNDDDDHKINDEVTFEGLFDMSSLNKRGDEYYGSHPVHGSDGGANFWINGAKNTWHCFRHGTGGGILSYIAMIEGLVKCSDATKGKIKGELFKKVNEVCKSKYNFEISSNDPNSKMKSILENIEESPMDAGEFAVQYSHIVPKDYVKYHQNRVWLSDSGKAFLKRLSDSLDVVKKIMDETEKIVFIINRTDDEGGIYKMYIKDQVLEIPLEFISSPTKFISLYYARFGELLRIKSGKGKDNSRDEWKEILDYWGSIRNIEQNDTIDMNTMICDQILEKLQDCSITENIESAVTSSSLLYYRNDDRFKDVLWYSNHNISKVLREARANSSPVKVKQMLSKYMSGNTTPFRVGKKLIRFWPFHISVMGFTEDELHEYLKEVRKIEADEDAGDQK